MASECATPPLRTSCGQPVLYQAVAGRSDVNENERGWSLGEDERRLMSNGDTKHSRVAVSDARHPTHCGNCVATTRALIVAR